MSGLISLRLSQPDLFKHGTTADVVDATKTRADYESSAPTGMELLPSMSDVQGWEQLLIGIKTKTGQIVTPEKAKRCATVLAIMRGLSEDVSSLGLPLYKSGTNDDLRAIDHTVYQLLNVAPNDIMTPLEMREHMMFDLMLWGNFYNLKNDDPDNYGEIGNLWPLSAAYVTRRWRELVWTFTDPTTGISGTFTPDLVWRGTLLSSNGLDGTAITLLCREAIGLLLAAEEQGARLFSHGVQTDLTLTVPESLGDDEKKQLRGAFMARHSGSDNAFMPLLLEGGMTASKLGLTAQESQYLESRAFQVSDIARAFRYPDVLLGSLGKSSKGSTYASAEQFFESYTKHTLSPWAVRIEQTGNRDLLSPKERKKYYLQHDFSSLLKANETARIANWNAKIQGGWAQPAEARRAENMVYKDGLDYFSKPAGSTGTAGAQPDPKLADPTTTDQSGQGDDLSRRVALHLLNKEQKALVASKTDADVFYTNFGSYIEQLTGADGINVRRYLEMRRNTPEVDRFTTGTDTALSSLISLCKGGTQ
jgi:HK97 family phage portal protein